MYCRRRSLFDFAHVKTAGCAYTLSMSMACISAVLIRMQSWRAFCRRRWNCSVSTPNTIFDEQMTKMAQAAQLAGLATQWYAIAEGKPFTTKLVLHAQCGKWMDEATKLKNEALTEMGFTFHKTTI